MIKEARVTSVVSLFPLPQYVVVLEDKEKTKLVPIWVGVNEGNAIVLEMDGEKFPRPLTHDLMINMLKSVSIKIEKIVITDLKENTYFAAIHLKHNKKAMVIDARPSDSLALAVRAKCPIYIDQSVLDKCPAVEGVISQTEVEKFKEQLKTMSPDEFFKQLENAPKPESEKPPNPIDPAFFDPALPKRQEEEGEYEEDDEDFDEDEDDDEDEDFIDDGEEDDDYEEEDDDEQERRGQ